MAYYSPEVIQKAKQIDLLTYLKNYDPEELVFFSKDTYTTREHDSLKISNGMWYWFSRGVGGKSALDYLIKVKDYSFTEAMEMLVNKINLPITHIFVANKPKNINFIMPKKEINNNKAIMYLLMRGIDKQIIDECISKQLIYQDKNNNVVFVGFDKNNFPKYAMRRGMGKERYFKEAYGSNKAFSFKINSEEESDEVHIFESAIDLLSYATLLKIKGKKWYNTNLLSLSGVYQPASDITKNKIPIAVEKFLENNKCINKIYLHLDSDNAGRLATFALINALEKDYQVIDSPPKYGKDVNDWLRYEINKKERRKER